MLEKYPELAKGEIEQFYNGFKSEDKQLIENYITYREARGLNDISMKKNVRRMILQTLYILQHPIKIMTIEELRSIVAVINKSKLSNHYKNNVKANFKNFVKFAIPDWSLKFSELEDIKTKGIGEHNQQRINDNTIFNKQEIDMLLKAELNTKWRTFLLLQYEAGLRTIEVRRLKWSDLKIDIEEGLTEVFIFATKTDKARTVYVKEATHYLKLLKREQENNNDKGIYIFHQRHNKNLPIAKFSVNEWFRKLTKSVLGREGWNYLLRHSRATELYRLAKQNKISKDIAVKFMGHSKDMSKAYDHPKKEEVKEMLKNQIYHIEELPPEKKEDYENRINSLEGDKIIMKLELKEMKEALNLLAKAVNASVDQRGEGMYLPFIDSYGKLINKGILKKSE